MFPLNNIFPLYKVTERIGGRRHVAQAQSCIYVLLKPSNVGLPAKSQTLLGRRLDEPANFLWLDIHTKFPKTKLRPFDKKSRRSILEIMA
ncbi:MAG: hypothetical protein LBF72_03380 [Holosporales bacterium]|nr:hypothetical protein [Holosporales bacterium]